MGVGWTSATTITERFPTLAAAMVISKFLILPDTNILLKVKIRFNSSKKGNELDTVWPSAVKLVTCHAFVQPWISLPAVWKMSTPTLCLSSIFLSEQRCIFSKRKSSVNIASPPLSVRQKHWKPWFKMFQCLQNGCYCWIISDTWWTTSFKMDREGAFEETRKKKTWDWSEPTPRRW